MKNHIRSAVILLTIGIILLFGMAVAVTMQQNELEQHYRTLERQADVLADLLKETSAESPRPQIQIFPEQTEAPAEATSETDEVLTEEPSEKAVVEANAVIFAEAASEAGPDAVRHTIIQDLSPRAIFVGDSRTVGLSRAINDFGDGCIYIGESGEGYEWFIDKGLDLMEDAIADHPDLPVIFNLGVNDCENITLYLEVYRELADSQPDTRFYYMSVNPVAEDFENVPNSEIDEFNRIIRNAFPDAYIDTSSKLRENGFETPDGLHYSEATYCDIHNYALEQLSVLKG